MINRETKFQAEVVVRLKTEFPGCEVLRNDPNKVQGIPDILVLMDGGGWAMLEVKEHEGAKEQPNQGWYVEKYNLKSFGAFIFPENADKVFDDLHRSFPA